jgi:hypothetical protein
VLLLLLLLLLLSCVLSIKCKCDEIRYLRGVVVSECEEQYFLTVHLRRQLRGRTLCFCVYIIYIYNIYAVTIAPFVLVPACIIQKKIKWLGHLKPCSKGSQRTLGVRAHVYIYMRVRLSLGVYGQQEPRLFSRERCAAALKNSAHTHTY